MRNSFEEKVAKDLGPEYSYEAIKLEYTTQHTYTPDFVDAQNKHLIEAKGYLSPADRRVLRAVKAQHPEWRITIIFQNPNAKLSKGSKTTYSRWAERHGFDWR